MSVLVFTENWDGKFKKMSFELVSYASKIAETYINMLTNKEFDENIDLEEAIVYKGVQKFPARIKCASIAWKAFEGTLESE